MLHYLQTGWREGRDPHPLFAADWYLAQNPEVARAGINPLVHFVTQGAVAGRSPHPLFDPGWYANDNPDPSRGPENALIDFLTGATGHARSPHPLFDARWYLEHNPDVSESGINPLLHYLTIGASERRDPHPLFDTNRYFEQAPDLPASRLDPLSHFVRVGAARRLDPCPLFDSAWYLARNPDLAEIDASPLLHYLQTGWREGRDPHPLFAADWYLAQNPEVARAGINPLVHFVTQGAVAGRSPHPLFDPGWYANDNPDPSRGPENALIDFLTSATGHARSPHPLFDSRWYLEHNPDVSESGINPLLHYLTIGASERRDPHPLFDTNRYFEQAPDLPASRLDPLSHFIRVGAARGLDPHPLFDTRWYREKHPDILDANPIIHYLTAGGLEGRDPHPLFSSTWYRERNRDILDANPLTHFVTNGWREGRDPSPVFDVSYYLQQYPDVAASGVNPVADYLARGARDGRNPSQDFDTNWYRATYNIDPWTNPLVHYVTEGAAAGYHVSEADAHALSAIRSSKSIPPPVSRWAHWIPDWQGDWSTLSLGSGADTDRILVIDWKPPTPDRDSGSYRMRMILEILVAAEPGAIDFVGGRAAESVDYVEALEAQGIKVMIGEEAALAHLMSHGGRYRAVWIARPELAERYLPMVRAFAAQARTLYDTVDLHWIRFERGCAFHKKPEELQALSARYRRIEMANAQAADVTIAITEEERKILLSEDPELAVAVIPNIHPLYPCATPVAARQDLFFIGGFNHIPNVDAVLYFTREIMPLVHEHLPDVRFHIVGSDMPESVLKLASTLVDPIGYVPDVAPWFAKSRIFVAPLRHGAGMKGKVGQSLSYGLPVVTTRIGAEGIGLTHEVDALIADDPVAFAAAIQRLYTDTSLWERISAAGQDLIRRRYSPEAVAKMLRPLVD